MFESQEGVDFMSVENGEENPVYQDLAYPFKRSEISPDWILDMTPVRFEMTDSNGDPVTISSSNVGSASKYNYYAPCELHRIKLCYACTISGGSSDWKPSSNYSELIETECPLHGIILCLDCAVRDAPKGVPKIVTKRIESDGFSNRTVELEQTDPEQIIDTETDENATSVIGHATRKLEVLIPNDPTYGRPGSDFPIDPALRYKNDLKIFETEEKFKKMQLLKTMFSHVKACENDTVKRVINQGQIFYTERAELPNYFTPGELYDGPQGRESVQYEDKMDI
jgi:hypothetical protein